MNKKSICPWCNNRFTKTHGNRLYCSTECKIFQKASTQNKLYGIIKEFRKGFLTNYKLFEKLVPDHGIKHFPITELNIQGFNSNCFYGWYTDDEKRPWYKVGPYHFNMTRNDQSVTISIKK